MEHLTDCMHVHPYASFYSCSSASCSFQMIFCKYPKLATSKAALQCQARTVARAPAMNFNRLEYSGDPDRMLCQIQVQTSSRVSILGHLLVSIHKHSVHIEDERAN